METPRNERQEKQDAERLRQENVVKAIKLIERNPEFSDVLVQIHDRNQALEAQMPTEAKERLSEARLTYLLKWVEIFGEAHLRVVTDLESVESLTTIMEHFVRATWLKFSGIPMEEIRPSPQFAQPHPTQSKRDKLLKAAQHWVMEWHRRLASLRKDQPEAVTEEQPSTRRKILEPNVDSLANPDVTQARAVDDSAPGSPPDNGPVGEPDKRVPPRPVEAPATEANAADLARKTHADERTEIGVSPSPVGGAAQARLIEESSIPNAYGLDHTLDFTSETGRNNTVAAYTRSWTCSEAGLARTARVDPADLSRWKKGLLPAESDKKTRIVNVLNNNDAPTPAPNRSTDY